MDSQSDEFRPSASNDLARKKLARMRNQLVSMIGSYLQVNIYIFNIEYGWANDNRETPSSSYCGSFSVRFILMCPPEKEIGRKSLLAAFGYHAAPFAFPIMHHRPS